MAYKMKGHALPGPNQRKSPAKQAMVFERDKQYKWGDAFRSQATKDARATDAAIRRSKRELELDKVATGIDQEHQKQMEARKGSRAAGLKPPVEDDNGNGENVEV